VQRYRLTARAASTPPASACADCDGSISGKGWSPPLTALRPVSGWPGPTRSGVASAVQWRLL